MPHRRAVTQLRRCTAVTHGVALAGWLAVVVHPSCSRGGQTGDGTGNQPDLPPGPTFEAGLVCSFENMDERPVTRLDVEAGELGFTPQAVLDQLQEPSTAQGSWLGLPGAGVPQRDGTTEVTLSFNYADGAVSLFTPKPSEAGAPQPEQLGAGPDCPPALRIDVEAHVSTADGALDERFPTQVLAYVPDALVFNGEMPANALQGSLKLDTAGDEWRTTTLTLSGAVTDYGTQGLVLLSGEGEIGAGVAFSGVVLQWPEVATCQTQDGASTGSFAVAEDAQLPGYTVAEAFAALSALEPAALQWSDGSESTVTLQLEEPSAACVSVDPHTGAVSLAFSAVVAATSADERWQGRYPAHVSFMPDPDGEGTLVDVWSSQSVSGADSDSLGLSSVAAREEQRVDLNLSVQLRLETGVLSGSLKVNAITDDPCPEPAPAPDAAGESGASEGSGSGEASTPGCVGSELLEDATLGVPSP